MLQEFYRILTAAIRDFTKHGFDNENRLHHWEQLIREAARRAMVPEGLSVDALHHALNSAFRKQVDKGGVLRTNPGMGRYTLEKIKPKLRAELDRRIVASAQLIKLNREQAIETTLRRFSGWATSIPVGGSKAVEKQKEAKILRKSLAQLSFIERRVAIDQTHKLIASINEIVAVDGGAIAAEWHSRWRVPNYDYRPDHKERDEQVYLIRGNWAQERGLVKPGPAGYFDAITRPGEEVFCFPGDSKIPFADGISKVFRHWYSGELAVIQTDSGKTLRGTPNHPILTTKGWVGIGSLQEGDDVIEQIDHLLFSAEKNQNDSIPTLAQIFSSINKSGVGYTADQRSANFHGDIPQSDIDIVFADGLLSVGAQSSALESLNKLNFSVADNFGFMERALFNSGIGLFFTAQRGVRSGNPKQSLMWICLRGANNIGFALISETNPSVHKTCRNRGAGHVEFPAQLQDAGARLISMNDLEDIEAKLIFRFDLDKPDTYGMQSTKQTASFPAENLCNNINRLPFRAQAVKVIKVQRSSYTGHVYNLQTKDGWYVADGIISHNCRCSAVYFHNLRDLPADMLTAKGKEALQRRAS